MAKCKILPIALTMLAFYGSSCGKKKDEKSKKVKVSGQTSVPAVFEFYPLYTSSIKRTGTRWYNCYKGTNDSGDQSVFLTVESTNNCGTTQQYLYFYQDPAIDMSDYETGSIELKVEVKNAGTTINAFIQDDNALTSNTVNLTAYGFDPAKTAEAQKIVIPISALTVAGFDFSKVARLLQLVVTCPVDSCSTDISDVKWRKGAEAAGLSLAKRPYCDPAPCGTLRNAPIKFYGASKSGWSAVPAEDSFRTDAEGNFSVSIDPDLFDEFKKTNSPIFIFISLEGDEFSFLAALPSDQLGEGDSIETDVDLTTTAAARMECPGGVAPIDGAGYCIGLPEESSEKNALEKQIDSYLEDNIPTLADLDAIIEAMIQDESIYKKLKNLVKERKGDLIDQAEFITLDKANKPPVTFDEFSAPSTDFPDNLEQGEYLVTISTCVNGSCSVGGSTTMNNGGVAQFKSAIESAMNQAITSCGSDGVTCTLKYNSISSTAFRATFTATACTDDVCATSSAIYDFRKS